jgi:hypothetical protein
MNAKRIQEIQAETGLPNSVSVQQALLKVWNECAHDSQDEIEQLKTALQGAENMLRGMTFDPAIPGHAKNAMMCKIRELEAAQR